MAKATAHCKCRICNGEFTRIKNNCRNRRQADQWEEWATKAFDLCPNCFRDEQRKKEKERGLLVSIVYNIASVRAGVSNKDRDIAFIFSGDSYSHKEELKEMGAKYIGDYPTGSSNKPVGMRSMSWVIYSSLSDYAETYNAVSTVAKVVATPTEA